MAMTTERVCEMNRLGAFLTVASASLIAVTAQPAEAQFVCFDNTSGGVAGSTAGGTSMACGTNVTTDGVNGIAIGNYAAASATSVVGDNAVAIGNETLATGASAVAIGQNANASGVSSMALGPNAAATHANAAAFGSGATTTRDNQQVFGTATNTYTMAGINSAASRAAQSGPLSIVSTDSNGNLAGRSAQEMGLATTSDIAALNTRIKENTEGIAIAFAMAGAPVVLPKERFAMSANWGNFEGSHGFAGALAMRVTDNVQLNGGIGVGADHGTVGGRAGIRVGW